MLKLRETSFTHGSRDTTVGDNITFPQNLKKKTTENVSGEERFVDYFKVFLYEFAPINYIPHPSFSILYSWLGNIKRGKGLGDCHI